MTDSDTVILKHRELEQIAIAALRTARALMECGARGEIVHQCAAMVARGLGAEDVHLRSGYASLSITVSSSHNTITRMLEVGRHGVDHRRDHAIRRLAVTVEHRGLTPAETVTALEAVMAKTRRYPAWATALAVGVACASFGRLLGTDWLSVPVILAAGALGQFLRHRLLAARRLNVFVVTSMVSFAASGLAGLAATLAGSTTIDAAMIAAVLMLVPGVPALNAQTDIMEGRPTLGSARAVWVLMALVFMTVGLVLSRALLGVAP